MSTTTESVDEAPRRSMPVRLGRAGALLVIRWVTRVILLIAAVVALLLVLRAYRSTQGPPLERWHLFVPDELSISQLDDAEWRDYLAAEEAIMISVAEEVTAKLKPAQRIVTNRYATESAMHPSRFVASGASDWNRSFTILPFDERGAPTGEPPVGAVVLLHGLTDSPYSLRHVARHYAEHGFVAVGIRLPGHGTVPAGLVAAEWEDWLAAARLAVREARRQVGADSPLHLVGYSMGGAIAVKYTLDSLEDSTLARPDRVVLMSPMVGVTRFAEFAGLAGLPSMFPAFAKSAWIDRLPEFNPFKYNSFPVNAATQSHRLSVAVQAQAQRMAAAGRLSELPPILTFQSVLDATVSTDAVLAGLYAHLPANGSEIVLFDVNRSLKFGPLLSSAADGALERMLPPLPQRYAITIIGNTDDEKDAAIERAIKAGVSEEVRRELPEHFPASIFSLSHVAIPFPLEDPLYGLTPDLSESFGVRLGTISARGERGALVMSLDSLMRASSNPLFPYLLRRLDEVIADPAPRIAADAAAAAAAGLPPRDVPDGDGASSPYSDHRGAP